MDKILSSPIWVSRSTAIKGFDFTRISESSRHRQQHLTPQRIRTLPDIYDEDLSPLDLGNGRRHNGRALLHHIIQGLGIFKTLLGQTHLTFYL
ncbi:hypothetical protein RRG08_025443 [Elysia crispata]|uniref:Uncharacterized protein n=1 Tax=Elysia crispata TaxID=231223 RepID=A0AAE1DC03_9GAST|nr:hypothetical protein RRG08_025443 [Elysia crispata]